MISTRRKKVMGIVLSLIIVGFVALSIFVKFDPASMFDRSFSKHIQAYQNPALDWVMEAISWFGYTPGSPIMVVSAAVLFVIFKYRREALFMLFTGLSGLVSFGLKVLINRPRPSEPLVHVFRKATEQSFPSGHTLFYVTYFGFLTMLMIQLKSIPKMIRVSISACSIFLIFSVPFSRIYLGAHWFTDVLGGVLVGVICLFTLSYFYERGANKQ